MIPPHGSNWNAESTVRFRCAGGLRRKIGDVSYIIMAAATC
jgi:hypothetical protein